jgi:uncharacterized protein (DUF1810 family)
MGMNLDPYDLDRFVAAQDADRTYEHAVAELHQGRKTSHWMWFVFPQISGLGRSQTARHFGISALGEARAYLVHPVLGPRLITCTQLLLDGGGRDATHILGSIDAQKLRSSMTLFLRADPKLTIFRDALEKFFDGAPDAATDQLL